MSIVYAVITSVIMHLFLDMKTEVFKLSYDILPRQSGGTVGFSQVLGS